MYNIEYGGASYENHYRNKGCPVKSKKGRSDSPFKEQGLPQAGFKMDLIKILSKGSMKRYSMINNNH
jgi:hypothetical protein